MTSEAIFRRRFMAKVEFDTNGGCWLWFAAHKVEGYGKFKYRGFIQKAHRVAWSMFRGDLPADQCVLHRCDVPACVNPAHLFLGTQIDNLDDMRRKGRGFVPDGVGENNGRAILDEQKVRLIRASHASREQLARRFDVTVYAIGDVINGRTWTHVEAAA